MSPTWSGVTETLANGNLGIPPVSPIGSTLIVGPCSLGTVGQLYIFGKADLKSIPGLLGQGDLVDRLADYFNLGGQNAKAIVVPANPDIVGTVTTVGQPYSSPAATIAGSPTALRQWKMKVTKGGANETARFAVSIDNGETYGDPITTPAAGDPVSIGYGLSVEFPAGTFVADELYTFTTTAPSCTLESLSDAIDVAVAAKLPFETIGVFTPTTAATWAGLGQIGQELFDAHVSVRIVAEANIADLADDPTAWVLDRVEEIEDFADDRVAVTAGLLMMTAFGKQALHGLSGIVCGLAAGFPIQRSVARTLYARIKGAVADVGLSDGELKVLSDARFIVAKQHVGMQGWFCNNSQLASGAESDYQSLQVGRVMDNVVRNCRATALRHLFDEMLVVDGVASKEGLASLEGDINGTLKGLKGGFSSARIEIPKDQDVIATEQINATITVVPLGYAGKINLTFGLSKV